MDSFGLLLWKVKSGKNIGPLNSLSRADYLIWSKHAIRVSIRETGEPKWVIYEGIFNYVLCINVRPHTSHLLKVCVFPPSKGVKRKAQQTFCIYANIGE